MGISCRTEIISQQGSKDQTVQIRKEMNKSCINCAVSVSSKTDNAINLTCTYGKHCSRNVLIVLSSCLIRAVNVNVSGTITFVRNVETVLLKLFFSFMSKFFKRHILRYTVIAFLWNNSSQGTCIINSLDLEKNQ